MPDVSFKYFQKKYPEYQDHWQNDYCCSCYVESETTTMIDQHGFYLDERKPERIKLLFSLGHPIIVYCGTEQLLKWFIKRFPEFESTAEFHPWYQDSIHAIVHQERRSKT